MAYLQSLGTRASRQTIVSELRRIGNSIWVSGEVISCPTDEGYRRDVPRDPALEIRVQCLRLAVELLTGEPSIDETIPSAVARIHGNDSLEIRA